MDVRIPVLAALLALAPLSARAALAASDIEDPLLVTRVDCTIVIDREGKVAEYTPHTELPAPIAERVRDMVRAVRFMPVEEQGRIVNAQVDMRVVVTATKLDDGGMRLAIENLVFPDEQKDPDKVGGAAKTSAQARVDRKTPLQYPRGALMAGGQADQLAVLRFGPDGKVADIAIEQSALVHGRASKRDAARLLDQFEAATLAGLRGWTVDPATIPAAELVDGGFIAYVPVKWRLGVNGDPPAEEKPGAWSLETRTRRRVPAWRPVVDGAPQPGVADLGTGEIGTLNHRYRLAKPLDASGS